MGCKTHGFFLFLKGGVWRRGWHGRAGGSGARTWFEPDGLARLCRTCRTCRTGRTCRTMMFSPGVMGAGAVNAGVMPGVMGAGQDTQGLFAKSNCPISPSERRTNKTYKSYRSYKSYKKRRPPQHARQRSHPELVPPARLAGPFTHHAADAIKKFSLFGAFFSKIFRFS